jgi:glutamine amidotransferase
VAFYEGRAARVFKEPVPAAESRCLAFIADYDFESTMVLAHIRKANPEKIGRTSANTHPFEREWNGRSWVFAHNGILPGLRKNPKFAVHRFRPLGETDSEHAFCVLMDAIAAAHARTRKGPSLNAIVETIRPVVDRLAEFGEFNFVLGNGESLIVHAHTKLHALHRSCRIEGCQRDVVLLATSPLTNEPWSPLAPRSMHVYATGRESVVTSRARARSGQGRVRSQEVSAIQNGEVR